MLKGLLAMVFELVPILNKMRELYRLPRDLNRFEEFLNTLVESSDSDIQIPIIGYNPMAKEHILDRLQELISMNAEKTASEALVKLNKKYISVHSDQKFQVFIILSDDMSGHWPDRNSSDYDSKFRVRPLIKRHFCTPFFWCSEKFDSDMIQTRITEYAERTYYLLDHPDPETLEEHIQMEESISAGRNSRLNEILQGTSRIQGIYEAHRKSTEKSVIFNFLYGDEAASRMGYEMMNLNEGILD